MGLRKVGQGKADANDAVEYECAPGPPAPAHAVIIARPEFDVEQVRTKWQNERGDESKRVTAVFDRYDLCQPRKRNVSLCKKIVDENKTSPSIHLPSQSCQFSYRSSST